MVPLTIEVGEFLGDHFLPPCDQVNYVSEMFNNLAAFSPKILRLESSLIISSFMAWMFSLIVGIPGQSDP